MIDDLASMAIFARVIEAGGFSKAARDLGVSKSSVSKQVSRLEDRLGVRLLNRTTRRLSLTEAGAAFYEGCQRVLTEAESAKEAVSHLASAPRGELKVNAPMSFGIMHLGPALPEFLERFPELNVQMVLNDRVVDLIDEGFDVGVRITRMLDSSLIARRLAPNRLVACAAPSYLKKHGTPRQPDDLKRHNCLGYSYSKTPGTWHFRDDAGRHKVNVRGRFTANNGDVIQAALLAGCGIAIQPSFIAGDSLRSGRLVRLFEPYQVGDESSVHAVFPANRNLSPKVRVFVDFLVERFGDAPYWDAGIWE
ncbi:LysR family transcriptional regulator [Pelagibius sp. Alg239-R121]|uniref:LysR family transcriptional regulator n=1 Tax=Pelagibius sp. Alg239-R121 TaxID=2993448 RepID=UPI0024A78831|nr:LysR family transcriptional regulator [Pelagibius sp. Alg239-R121]